MMISTFKNRHSLRRDYEGRIELGGSKSTTVSHGAGLSVVSLYRSAAERAVQPS